MAASKRVAVTVSIDSKLHRAARRYAARAGTSVSVVMNEALRQILDQEREYDRLVRERRRQPARPYAEFEAELRRDGRL